MSRLYDCFTYFNEDLLLELRLATLDELVDTFVIAESTHTFSGKPKDLYFSIDRFERYQEKIVYLVIDDMPLELNNSWANEAHQRNALVRGLKDASPEDRVIISDIDEIPRPEAIQRYRPWNLSGTFVQNWYNYKINNQAVSCHVKKKPRDWVRPKITTIKHLLNFFGTPENLRIFNKERSLSGWYRYVQKKLRHQWLKNGGWHFSWLMTEEEMIRKIESYSHTDHDIPEITQNEEMTRAIREGRDILGKGEFFSLVEIDHSFPAYIQNNLDRFNDFYIPLK